MSQVEFQDKRRPVPVAVGEPQVAFRGDQMAIMEQTVQIGPRVEVREFLRVVPQARLLVTSPDKNILLVRQGSEAEGWNYSLPGVGTYHSLTDYESALAAGKDIIEESGLKAFELSNRLGVGVRNMVYLGTSEFDSRYFAVQAKSENLAVQTAQPQGNIQAGWYDRDEVWKIVLGHKIQDGVDRAYLMRHLLTPAKQAGLDLIHLVEQSNLGSLRLRSSNLAKLGDIRAIVFVGSSCVGKSTIVDAVRDAVGKSGISEKFFVPQRLITRPPRLGDNLRENAYTSPEELEQMFMYGEVGVNWIRHMEGTRTEQYAFPRVRDGLIPVYSANNDILRNRRNLTLNELLHHALIIGVYAPESIRAARLLERSPDMKPDEAAYRLGDRSGNIIPESHLLVKNFRSYEDMSQEDIVQLLRLISSLIS